MGSSAGTLSSTLAGAEIEMMVAGAGAVVVGTGCAVAEAYDHDFDFGAAGATPTALPDNTDYREYIDTGVGAGVPAVGAAAPAP